VARLPCELVPVTFLSERPGSGTINFGKSGVSGTRKWVVPWLSPDGSDYITRVQQLLGQTIAGPTGLPAITYPDVFSMELPWLYCQEVDVEGEDCVGTDAWGRIAYRRAVLTAKYMPYEMGESFSLSAQALSMQENTFAYLGGLGLGPPPPFYGTKDNADNAFSGGGAPSPSNPPDPAWLAELNSWALAANRFVSNPGIEDDVFQKAQSGNVAQPVTKIIPLGEYSLDRQQVLAPNFWAFIAMLGSINAYYFLGFPPWTLLFSGVEGKRSVMPNGTRAWDLTFKLHFNPNSWNHLYRGETGRWEIVAATGLSVQTYWALGQSPSNPNSMKTPPDMNKLAKGPLHGYLYRPADFAPILFFS
jgi:hypothetical protein